MIGNHEMEKRTPHYKLSKVQETVADPESQPFTITALRGGLELGLLGIIRDRAPIVLPLAGILPGKSPRSLN